MQRVVRSLLFVAVATSMVSATRSYAQDEQSIGTGAVFVMTNAADRNTVISFRRAEDGSLRESRRETLIKCCTFHSEYR